MARSVIRCFICNSDQWSKNWHQFRKFWFCSGKCNNQAMRMLNYPREVKHSQLMAHSQDLREDGGLIHKRGWIHFGRNVFGWCIYVGRIACGISLDVGCNDETFGLDIAIPGISLWFHLELPILYNKIPEDRTISLRFHDRSVWWKLWANPMEWSSKTPRWRDGCFHFDDFLFGRMNHTEKVLVGPINIEIPMPEGVYQATYTLSEATWTRSRRWFGFFPKPIQRLCGEIEIKEGIPFSGKGENSYDCGDDGLYGSTFSPDSYAISEAVEHVQKTVFDYRKRYGMPSDAAFISRGKIIPRSNPCTI